MATENPKRKLTLNQYAEELRGWLHLCQQVQMTNYSSQAYMMGLACQPPQSFTQPNSQSANNTANRPDNTAPANNQQQPQTPPRNFPESAGECCILNNCTTSNKTVCSVSRLIYHSYNSKIIQWHPSF